MQAMTRNMRESRLALKTWTLTSPTTVTDFMTDADGASIKFGGFEHDIFCICGTDRSECNIKKRGSTVIPGVEVDTGFCKLLLSA